MVKAKWEPLARHTIRRQTVTLREQNVPPAPTRFSNNDFLESDMKILAAALAAIGLATAANAVPVTWTDWTASTVNSATGSLALGTGTVGVTFENSVNNYFVNTSGGTYYYTGGAYTAGAGAPDTAPTTSDIIALGLGGTSTISFDDTVTDIFLAFVSWNVGPFVFSDPVEIIYSGGGYYGFGRMSTSDGYTVTESGEPHGVLKLSGDFDSFSFTTPSEGWHGFTIGVAGLAVSEVPIPATAPLLLIGVGGIAALRRRNRRT